MNNIPDDIKDRIVAEPQHLSVNTLAKKYKLSWYSVDLIRRPERTAKKKPASIEVVRKSPTIQPIIPIDLVIEDIEEQIAMFQQALSVVQGLREI